MPQQLPAAVRRLGLSRSKPVDAVVLGHTHQRGTEHQRQHMHLAEHQHGHRQCHAATDQQRRSHQQDRPQRTERQPHQQQHRRQRSPANGVDLAVGLHGRCFGMQWHTGMQHFQIGRSGLGRLPGAFQQATQMPLAIQLEGRIAGLVLQHRPMLAVGFEQTVLAQLQTGTPRLLLPPLRPQRQRVLSPLGQARRAHRPVQAGQRLPGQIIGSSVLQLLALLRRQQAVAVRRIETARLIEPAFHRTAGAQQATIGIGRHRGGKGRLCVLHRFTIRIAHQHHHLACTGIGDATGDIGQQRVVRITRQQREDVGVDPRLFAPQPPLLRAQGQQQQQPGPAQPMPPATQRVRCVDGLSQNGGPRRH
ncbi:hypothetical protein D3C71_1205940 [compost metagenome]